MSEKTYIIKNCCMFLAHVYLGDNDANPLYNKKKIILKKMKINEEEKRKALNGNIRHSNIYFFE